VSLGHKECVCLYDTLNTRNPCVSQGMRVSLGHLGHKESLCLLCLCETRTKVLVSLGQNEGTDVAPKKYVYFVTGDV